MQLGYNTNGLQNHRLEDALMLLADEGYTAVALTPDVQHLDPWRCSAADVARVASLLRRLGLQPVIETGARFLLDRKRKHEPTLMTREAAGRELRLDFYERCARLGAELGARVLSFWTGVDHARDAHGDAGANGDARDADWRWLLDGVAATCQRVRAAGLTPALEPEPGMAIATMEEFAAMHRALGAHAPALCLDVGHLYATGERDPIGTVRAWAGRAVQVHLEDMRRGVHEHLLPGLGDVDFGAVRSALEAGGYAGAVCFELSRSSHVAPDAVRVCREVWAAATKAAER